MRASEFLKENASDGATVSGSVAAVAQPLGSLVARGILPKKTKYSNSYKNPVPLRKVKNAR